MKKLILIICILMMINPVYAGLIGDFYQNEQYGCSMNGYGWKADLSGKKKLISFKNEDDGISEVSLDVVPAKKFGAENAKQIAIARIEAYDSWMYVGGRQMEQWEIGNANAADGFIVMYSKNLFSKTSGTIKLIVTEKYYMKGGNAYMVTILTTSQAWYSVKSTLLKIANSFKIT
ncbi:hypothetical protein ACFL5G_00540 [Candidatus Margulisiibacteriota bacterium]